LRAIPSILLDRSIPDSYRTDLEVRGNSRRSVLIGGVEGCARRGNPERRKYCRSRLKTIAVVVSSQLLSGGRAFPVVGPAIWNSLPDNAIFAPSLSTFRQRLKRFCSSPRSLTLSLTPSKLFPTSSGS